MDSDLKAVNMLISLFSGITLFSWVDYFHLSSLDQFFSNRAENHWFISVQSAGHANTYSTRTNTCVNMHRYRKYSNMSKHCAHPPWIHRGGVEFTIWTGNSTQRYPWCLLSLSYHQCNPERVILVKTWLFICTNSSSASLASGLFATFPSMPF